MTFIEPGRYVCLSTPGWLGWLVRQATHSAFNHVVVTGPDGAIIEATPHGVRKTILSRYRNHLACANLAEAMTVSQGLEVWAAAEAMLGDPYDFPLLAVLGAVDLGWRWDAAFRLLGAGPWRICSQLAVQAGQAATPPLDWLCGKGSPDQVTPADLAGRPGMVPVTIT